MSQIQVDNIYNKEGTGSPNFPLGANVTGVITATSFSGSGANLTGIDATALKDSNGTVRVQANTTGAVITGNVSVGGTLTYEDVTNIDAVGLITARSGIHISGNIGLGGATYGTAGQVLTSGGSGANATWTAISAAPEITANAASNISAGTAVVVNSSGQFAGVTSTTVAKNPGTWTDSTSDGAGTNLLIGSSTEYRQVAFDPNNGITMIMFKRSGSNNATAVKAMKVTTTGALTLGSEGELSNANYGNSNVCYAGQGRFVATYRNTSGAMAFRVLTVNTGTLAITVSSEILPGGSVAVVSGANYPLRVIWHPATNKLCVFYVTSGQTYYRLYYGTMNYSSNTIDSWHNTNYPLFGSTETQIVNTVSKNAVYDPDTEKIIFSAWYNGSSASYSAQAITFDGSGNASLGTRFVINTDGNIPDGNTSVDYDTLHNKVVFQWRYGSSYKIRTANVAANGTITGNTTAILATNAASIYNTMSCAGNGTFGFTWKDSSTSDNMALKTGNIAANGTITVTSEIGYLAYNAGQLEPRSSVFDSTAGRLIVMYYESSGDTKITSASISSVDSTSTAYVGIANTTVTTGQSLVVRTFGGTNTYQTGLSTGSTYYVQSNGTLLPTADVPSVIGGVALNGTTLLVKS